MAGQHMYRISWIERVLSVLILCALAALAYRLLHPTHKPNEQVAQTSAAAVPVDPPKSQSAANTQLDEWAPRDFQPLGAAESFSRDTAFEKIDGKVEFYLPLGFRSLLCQRFISKSDGTNTFELLVHDMGSPDGAFSAFTLQRRDGTDLSDISPFAYFSENLLAFVHDSFYVELVASAASTGVVAAMEETAQRFVSAHPASTRFPLEVGWFPPERLKRETMALILHNGFGFEGFTRLFTAVYDVSGSELQAFFMRSESPRDALDLFAAYSAFLIDNGAVFEASLPDIPEGRVYNVFGTYELVFVAGSVVGGVHQADDLDAARAAAKALHAQLMKHQQK
jgi:hypothetical protein